MAKRAEGDLLEDMRMQRDLTAKEEEDFWAVRLPQAQAKYPSVVRSVQQEILSARKKVNEELRKANEEALKDFEQYIKDQRLRKRVRGTELSRLECERRLRGDPKEGATRSKKTGGCLNLRPELEVKSRNAAANTSPNRFQNSTKRPRMRR